MDHLKSVIQAASNHNVPFLVFGCPRNRQVLPETEDPDTVFTEFFQGLGNYCSESGVIICIEPNAKDYGCNYLNTIEEVGRIVTRIDHPSIRMMVDIGNIMMERDDITKITEYKHLIYNVDIAQPKMGAFIDPQKEHIQFRKVINKHVNTNRTLEMLAVKDLGTLNKSLENFISLYGR
jgi:sugar phosphate isomerase/epimerase